MDTEKRKIEPAELTQILELHAKWRSSFGAEGARANLARANLARANLADANLADANLAGADLAGADLARADLADANLTGADLADANLAGADLAGADLARADLADANLTGADLADANLAGANLADANLARANLARANLADANLARANLAGADLAGADLTPIKNDFFEVLDSAPIEVLGVIQALRDGRVDGSTYHGECACLIGTIANLKKCDPKKVPGLPANSNRPAERFFLAIRKGDTPANSQAAALAEKWAMEWIERGAKEPIAYSGV